MNINQARFIKLFLTAAAMLVKASATTPSNDRQVVRHTLSRLNLKLYSVRAEFYEEDSPYTQDTTHFFSRGVVVFSSYCRVMDADLISVSWADGTSISIGTQEGDDYVQFSFPDKSAMRHSVLDRWNLSMYLRDIERGTPLQRLNARQDLNWAIKGRVDDPNYWYFNEDPRITCGELDKE